MFEGSFFRYCLKAHLWITWDLMKTPASIVPIDQKERQAPTPEKLDELGELHRQLQLIEPRFNNLKEEVLACYEKDPPAESIHAQGHFYRMDLSARGNKRTILDNLKVFNRLRKLIGLKELVRLITIPLEAAIDKHLPETEHDHFVKKERTGPRRMTLVSLHPAQTATKAA